MQFLGVRFDIYKNYCKYLIGVDHPKSMDIDCYFNQGNFNRQTTSVLRFDKKRKFRAAFYSKFFFKNLSISATMVHLMKLSLPDYLMKLQLRIKVSTSKSFFTIRHHNRKFFVCREMAKNMVRYIIRSGNYKSALNLKTWLKFLKFFPAQVITNLMTF